MSIRFLLASLGKIVLALFIGACITLFFLEKDHRFKMMVEKKVKQFFKESFRGDLEGTVVEVNLLWPTLKMKNLVVTPVDDTTNWSWHAQSGTLHFSWLSLLLHGKIAIHIMLNKYEATSAYEHNELAIAYHLQRLFEPPALEVPAFLKSLQIYKGIFHVYDTEHALDCTVHLHCDMKKIGQKAKVSFYPHDGMLQINQKICGERFAGSVLVDAHDTAKGLSLKVLTSLTFNLPQLATPSCFLHGSWDSNHGNFSLHNSDRTFVIDPLTINNDNMVFFNLRSPLSTLVQCLTDIKPNEPIEGTCTVHAKTNLANPLKNLRADIALHSMRYKRFSCAKAKGSAESCPSGIKGTLDLMLTPSVMFQASGIWHENKGARIKVCNTTPLEWPGWFWSLPAGSITGQVDVANIGDMCATYSATAHHALMNTSMTSTGSIVKKGAVIQAAGKVDTKKYNVECILTPSLVVRSGTISENGATLVSVSGDQSKMQGALNYAFIRSFFSLPLRDELSGEGILAVETTLQEKNGTEPLIIKGRMHLENGTIKIPQLYNFLQKFDAHFVIDVKNRNVVVTDMLCSLHRGGISSKRISMQVSPDYMVSYMHLPLIFDSCFMSWQKDLFAIISGSLQVTYQQDKPLSLGGIIIADKAQLKGNLFSNELQQSLLLSAVQAPTPKTSEIELDLHIMTKEPLVVKTSFLEAKAKGNIAIKNTVSSPEVTGSIEILNGTLNFPYKPLLITHGLLTFMPQQTYDPLIELTAKNKVKKYTVTLQVNGSLQNPHIRFESAPTLTEEQVIALLLAGAESSSLHMLMPTLVMQNLQHIIFGPAQSSSKLNTYFKSIFKPLANVRIVPRFTDETGRGGLRGAIEVEVSDQLSGVIERNFSLTEDIKLEVDYLLSDDVSLRGLQDERGDLGAEMEVRWKF